MRPVDPFGMENTLLVLDRTADYDRLLAEYDAALNDNADNDAFGEGMGYLNVALSWLFAEQLRIQFDLRNLL